MELLEELTMHQTTYTEMFGIVELQELYQAIDIPPDTMAIERYWMSLPSMGFLIASRYNVVLLFLSNLGDTTCFPLWSPESQQHNICVIARVYGNHFVKVDLQGCYPVPPTHPLWNTYKWDGEWEHPYKHQQDMYIQLRRSNYKSSFENLDK
ncbi:uncharacterized protein [Rutidosis leptorrhynchoides]|uniref:uncharacterized protein n=1 Tax=Rutidosis leptorrhynchoides TaxID=125765 RepID=UPI003A9A5C0E